MWLCNTSKTKVVLQHERLTEGECKFKDSRVNFVVTFILKLVNQIIVDEDTTQRGQIREGEEHFLVTLKTNSSRFSNLVSAHCIFIKYTYMFP